MNETTAKMCINLIYKKIKTRFEINQLFGIITALGTENWEKLITIIPQNLFHST